ncbi:hypothetical protein PVAND_006833 [Polypedilum vanderplanki]|uniref:Uncharacterized protein n=1 Tax=Polypedilum vanderplanki TaxID=319348 RepID=A0A9J6C4H6_POLVA|nr:hypothetical protein PVAND_006833 [Polypedilum vanderplanki]
MKINLILLIIISSIAIANAKPLLELLELLKHEFGEEDLFYTQYPGYYHQRPSYYLPYFGSGNYFSPYSQYGSFYGK